MKKSYHLGCHGVGYVATYESPYWVSPEDMIKKKSPENLFSLYFKMLVCHAIVSHNCHTPILISVFGLKVATHYPYNSPIFKYGHFNCSQGVQHVGMSEHKIFDNTENN